MAPFLHVYFPLLNRLIPGSAPLQVAKRVVADLSIAPPITLPLVFGTSAILQGKPETAWPRIQQQLVPAWMNGALYWPVIHSFNFRLVAVANQPLVAHIASVPWNMVRPSQYTQSASF